jgi:hypothetical protein
MDCLCATAKQLQLGRSEDTNNLFLRVEQCSQSDGVLLIDSLATASWPVSCYTGA